MRTGGKSMVRRPVDGGSLIVGECTWVEARSFGMGVCGVRGVPLLEAALDAGSDGGNG